MSGYDKITQLSDMKFHRSKVGRHNNSHAERIIASIRPGKRAGGGTDMKHSPCWNRLLTLAGVLAATLLVAPVQSAVAADASATEGNDITFTVKKPNHTTMGYAYPGKLRYSVETKDGEATGGDDFTELASDTTVTFGDSDNASVDIVVRTLTDSTDEGDGETFTVELSDPQKVDQVSTDNQGNEVIQWQSTSFAPTPITLTGKILEP